jgi:hypothetical protein
LLVGSFSFRVTLIAAPVLGHQDPQKPDSYSTKTEAHSKPTTTDQPKMTSSGAIAQKTRKAIYAEMSLSAFAHHVKIGTQDREVTLQGPVRSGEEKSNIFTKGRRGRGRRQGHEQDRNNIPSKQ